MKKIISSIFIFTIFTTFSFGQVFNMQSDTVNIDCVTGGTLYDSGGPAADYANDETNVLTICTNGDPLAATLIGANFTSPGDFLCIFDGPSTASSLIYCFTQTSGLPSGAEIRASIGNASGCLTFQFASDSSGTGNFEFMLGCAPACQSVEAEVVGTDPLRNIVDTIYVDLCFEDTMQFFGGGIYSENNTVYAQSDATSEFYWSYGDGFMDTAQNPFHFYESAGIYPVGLIVEDVNGCQSINEVALKVRKSPFPDLQINRSDTVLCLDEVVTLTGFIDGVTIDSVYIGDTLFLVGSAEVTDTVFLPDDAFPPSGNGLTTPVIYNLPIGGYIPGTVMTNVNDLIEICLGIEHSFVGDLDIILECPSGQTVALVDFSPPGTPGWNLGIPGTATVPGTPGQYCWSPASTATAIDVGAPFAAMVPSGTYSAVGNWNNLLGCPLNGNWSIQVFDDYGGDDGWTFNASIEFDPTYLAEQDTLILSYTNPVWEANPNIITPLNDTTIQVTTNDTSFHEYIFTIEDQFGCEYSDTTTLEYDIFNVIATPEDTTICGSDSIQLDVTVEDIATVCTGDYLVQPIPLSLVPTNGGTLNLGDDQLSTAINIGFPFEFFCDDYTDIFVSSNGFASFDGAAGSGCCSGQNLPQAGFGPNNVIALMWSDLNPNNGGTITYGLSGTAPNRIFAINFTSIPHFGNAAATVTGQMQLHESGNIVEIHCVNCVTDNGVITMGIENLDGTSGYTPPGYNASSWTSTNEGWRFVPAGALGAFNILWTPNTGLTADNISNPIAGPATSQIYSVGVTDFNNCTYYDTVSINVGGSFELIEPNDTAICQGDSVQLEVLGGGQIFTWSPSDGSISDTSISNPVFSPDSTTTYTVVVDSFGCSISRDVTITVSDPQLDTAIVTDVTCFNLMDGIIDITASQGLPGYTYSIDGIAYQMSNQFTGVDTGTYQVFVADSIGCLDSAIVVVVQPDLLEVDSVMVDSALCNGSSDGTISFLGLGGTGPYDYSIDNGGSYSGGINTFTGLSAGAYQLVVMDANMCISATFDTIIDEPTAIVLTLDSSANSSCNTDNGFVEIGATGGTPAYTYSIDGLAGQATGDFGGLAMGPHQVIVTDANGCMDTIDVVVLEDPSVVLATVGFDSVTCNGDGDAMLEVVASMGVLPYTFTLDDGTTQISQLDSVFTMLDGGVYTVSVTDANGCSDSVSITIFEPAVLDVSAVQDSVNCFGEANGSITVTSAGGTMPYEYSLDGFGSTQAGNVFGSLSAGTYTVSVRDANLCDTTFMIDVEEPDTLMITNVMVSNIDCNGDADGSFTITATGGTAPYSYSNDGINFQSSNTIGMLNGGNYTISVRDINGCISSVSDSITEPTILALTIDSSLNVTCNGGMDGAIYASATGGTTPYQFNIGGGNQMNDDFIGLSANSYTLTVTDGNGCTQTQTINIIEPGALSASITQTSLNCSGDSDGEITVVNVLGGTGPYEVQLGADPFIPFVPGMSFGSLVAGTYTINISDANGCPNYTENVTISEPSLFELDAALTIGTDPSCSGDSDGTIDVVTNGGGTTPYTYYINNAITGDTTSNATGAFIDLEAGIYPVWVIDANGCSDVSTITLTDPLAIVPAIDTAINESCFGFGDGQLQLSATGGVAPFTYALADGTPSDGPGTFTNLDDGIYTVVVTDANGCTQEITGYIEQGVVVDASIAADTTVISMGDTLHVTASLTPANSTLIYEWTPTEGLSCTDCSNPIITVNADVEYTVSISDSVGCADDASIDIEVIDALYYFIPNAFTPGNTDNMNDDFRVYGQDIKFVEMIVYNRWGEKVFESANPYVRWDGMYKGVLQQPGVYTYFVNITFLNDKNIETKGSVTLLR